MKKLIGCMIALAVMLGIQAPAFAQSCNGVAECLAALLQSGPTPDLLDTLVNGPLISDGQNATAPDFGPITGGGQNAAPDLTSILQ